MALASIPSSIVLLLTSAAICLAEAASSPDTSCLLKIDGVIYEATPCETNFEDEALIRFGGSRESGGYSVSIPKVVDRQYHNVTWSDGATEKQKGYSIGSMQRDGDCWLNQRARFCRNIDPSEPFYYIDRGKPDPFDDTLRAFWQGQEYIVERPGWTLGFPRALGPKSDFDGDGTPDQIVEMSLGGNVSPGHISIVSFHGDGFFTFLNAEPLPNGWDGYKVLNLHGRVVLRVRHNPTGAGNTADEQYHADWAFIDGDMTKISERKNYARPDFIVSLNAEEVRKSPNQMATLTYDVDLDGKVDSIWCGYWERWGTMNCDVDLSGPGSVKLETCKKIGVLRSVVRSRHLIGCDQKQLAVVQN